MLNFDFDSLVFRQHICNDSFGMETKIIMKSLEDKDPVKFMFFSRCVSKNNYNNAIEKLNILDKLRNNILEYLKRVCKNKYLVFDHDVLINIKEMNMLDINNEVDWYVDVNLNHYKCSFNVLFH